MCYFCVPKRRMKEGFGVIVALLLLHCFGGTNANLPEAAFKYQLTLMGHGHFIVTMKRCIWHDLKWSAVT